METWEEKKERLRIWTKRLTEDKKDEIILELVEELIDDEEIYFWEDSESPYWRKTGEYIDKTNKVF